MSSTKVPPFRLVIDEQQSPQAWMAAFLDSEPRDSDALIAQHFIEAVLQRRFYGADSSEDRLIQELEPFGKVFYCVIKEPSRETIQICSQNIRSGYQSVLLVPYDQVSETTILAQDEGVEKNLAIMPLESFVATIILGLAVEEQKHQLTIFREIVEIYNKRLSDVETDLSLLIEVR